MPVIAGLAARLPGRRRPVGVAFPSVVKHGMVRTAANIDHAWIGVDGAGAGGASLSAGRSCS